ncbi:MAG: UPF0182 family protein [Dolichospermum sp.]
MFGFGKWWVKVFIFCLGLCLFLKIAADLGAEFFWFQEVGYIEVFSLKLLTQGSLWLFIVSLSVVYLWGNLILAEKLQSSPNNNYIPEREINISRELSTFLSPYYHKNDQKLELANNNNQIKLKWLLPLTLGLSLLVCLILAYYGEIALAYGTGKVIESNLSNLSAPIVFKIEMIWKLGKKIISQNWYLGIVGGLSIALLIYSKFMLRAIAVFLSLIFGQIIAENWQKFLLFFHPVSFNSSEPLFNQNISFYIFSLPIWEILELWLIGLSLYGFISVILTYLLSANSLNQGIFRGFSTSQKRHLLGLFGCLMLVAGLNYWLNRYQLLYSDNGVSYGASYTDIKAQLPADTILYFLSIAIAFYSLYLTVFWKKKSSYYRWIKYSIYMYLTLITTGNFILPITVQNLIVEPNE